MSDLKRRLERNKALMQRLINDKMISGSETPGGRITFQKHVDNKSFARFSPILKAIAPASAIYDRDARGSLPSFARALRRTSGVGVYPRYLFVNATLSEYMDYEEDEDREEFEALLARVDRRPVGHRTIGIAIQNSEAMESAHAIAFVCWRPRRGAYRFAYYDSLAYRRGSTEYDFSKIAFRPGRFGDLGIDFVDLTEYCYRKPGSSDYHCVQYVMNADYCYVYALFFLHQWLLLGARASRSAFRRSIEATYVVRDASKLTRATTRESMIYRVVIVSFLCEHMIRYLRLVEKSVRAKKHVAPGRWIDDLTEFARTFEDSYGLRLV